MKKSETATHEETDPGVPAAPAEFLMPLFEFAQTHSPGRDIELMGGFMHYARQQGWAQATPSDWAHRFEAFRSLPAR